MKNTIALLLTLVLLATFVSCGGAAPKTSAEVDLGAWKTVGDVQKIEKENDSWGYGENENGEIKYVEVFEYDGTTYRIFADLSREVYDAMDALDFFDEQREEKMNKILAVVPVTLAEDMTKYIPTEEDLQAYVGKTGQELLDDDFWFNGYWLDDDQHFFMCHDLWALEVYFNEHIDVSDNMDDFDEEEAIRNLTVKKMVFTGFSDRATDF